MMKRRSSAYVATCEPLIVATKVKNSIFVHTSVYSGLQDSTIRVGFGMLSCANFYFLSHCVITIHQRTGVTVALTVDRTLLILTL